MARLFGKEYHNHSNTWYFKNTIKNYTKDDIKFRFWKNDSDNIIFEFEAASNNILKSFDSVLIITYNQQNNTILNYNYQACKNKEICPVFLSILNYCYKYL